MVIPRRGDFYELDQLKLAGDLGQILYHVSFEYLVLETLTYYHRWGCCGHHRVVVGFITTYAIIAYHHYREFDSHSCKVYSIQHYVMKFVWLATGLWFFAGTPVSSTNKTDRHNITEILLKVALNTITLTLTLYYNK